MTPMQEVFFCLKMVCATVLGVGGIAALWYFLVIRKLARTCSDCEYSRYMTWPGCKDNTLSTCSYPLPRHLEHYGGIIVAGKIHSGVNYGNEPKRGQCKAYRWDGKYMKIWRKK